MADPAAPKAPILRFGPFQLDIRAGELRKFDIRLRLREQPLQILHMLLEHPGEVVLRDEIRHRLWPNNTIVEFDHGINAAIQKLRDVLGESADQPRYIETVVRRGYRFLGEVEVVGMPAQQVPPEAAKPELEPVVSARSKWKWALVGLVLAIAAAGAVVWKATPLTASKVDSVVVLPFVNMSAEGDTEFFSDGLTEEITNALTGVPGLRVVARTTAFQFKGKPGDIRQLGNRLQVSAVLEGSVRRQGARLRVTAQLSSVRYGYHYWSQVWDRDLKDVFAVQEDIARRVADSVRYNSGESTRLVRPPTHDMEAYNLFLQGRFYEHRVFSADKAISFFQRAIDKDPNFALAYTGLATCYADLGYYNQVPPREAYPKAVAALRKALDLDPSLARVHALQGLISLVYDWDWPAAQRELRRAIELNPSDAEVHDYYSHFLVTVGRFDESLAQTQRAIVIDPLDQVRLGHLAWHYLMARDPRQAIVACEHGLEIDPNHAPSLTTLQRAYESTGRFEEAIGAAARRGVASQLVTALRQGLAADGPKGYWRAWRDEFISQSRKKYIGVSDIAPVLARLGQKQEAIEWLDRGYRERDSWLVYLNVEPAFDALRGETRFQDLVKRVGLPAFQDPSVGNGRSN